jgi:hypothetical protein
VCGYKKKKPLLHVTDVYHTAMINFSHDSSDSVGSEQNVRRQQGVKLYYKVLEAILLAEEERLLRVCTYIFFYLPLS